MSKGELMVGFVPKHLMTITMSQWPKEDNGMINRLTVAAMIVADD